MPEGIFTYNPIRVEAEPYSDGVIANVRYDDFHLADITTTNTTIVVRVMGGVRMVFDGGAMSEDQYCIVTAPKSPTHPEPSIQVSNTPEQGAVLSYTDPQQDGVRAAVTVSMEGSVQCRVTGNSLKVESNTGIRTGIHSVTITSNYQETKVTTGTTGKKKGKSNV